MAPRSARPLIETSRRGYLEAVSVSAYSNVALVRELGPLMRPGGSFLSLSYIAGQRAIPGYGGGMSSAKAALESDTRTLAYRGRAALRRPRQHHFGRAVCFARCHGDRLRRTMIDYSRINSPSSRDIESTDVGYTAAFLASPLAAAITGSTVYVDNGYAREGMAVVSTRRPIVMNTRLAATTGAVVRRARPSSSVPSAPMPSAPG